MIKGIVLLSCYVLTAGLFCFSHQLANDTPPYSSMGNLALIALPFLAILTLTIVLFLSAILREKQIRPLPAILVMLVFGVHVTIGVYWQVQSLEGYRDTLLERYNDYGGFAESNHAYIEAITSGFENQMNSQYFNVNTWLVYVSFTILLSLALSLFRLKTKTYVSP
ncbi:hypothetical protein JCM19046_2951 [Bacillus sp. JCM 19046]|nr:hypothetical protein JCM19045_524 [Bacillus sp. JCM 19045]GAF18378.1 hypothetical protein JCM19046_2951 [Bacillus sp. JCM 19046]